MATFNQLGVLSIWLSILPHIGKTLLIFENIHTLVDVLCVDFIASTIDTIHYNNYERYMKYKSKLTPSIAHTLRFTCVSLVGKQLSNVTLYTLIHFLVKYISIF